MSFCIFTDITLTKDHKDKVFNALFEARNNWYFIGKGIGYEDADLDEIQAQHHSDKHRCYEMLKIRIQKGGLKLSTLCNCLRGKFVGRNDIAQKIEALFTPT